MLQPERFLNAREFNNIENYDGFKRDLHEKLEEVIMGEFHWFGDSEFYIDNMSDVGKGMLLMQARVSTSTSIGKWGHYMSDFVELYADNRDRSVSNLKSILTGDSFLFEGAGSLPMPLVLSNMCVVTIYSLRVAASVSTSLVENHSVTEAIISPEVLISLEMSIRSVISKVADSRAIRLRLEKLCSSMRGYLELAAWAEQIGIAYQAPPSQDKLCSDIKGHYGFY